MSASELMALARERRLFSDRIAAKTPHNTMRARLSVHVRRHGQNSIFVRTGPGHFFLRKLVDPTKIFETRPLRAPLPAERVLASPTEWLDQRGRFQGIRTVYKGLANDLLRQSICTYMERLDAERSDSFKQILTYVMVTRGSRILAFRRGSYSSVEDYLRGSLCVGFGGHVSESDSTLFNRSDLGLADSAVRELTEELRLPAAERLRLEARQGLNLVGVLNDDSSAVGRRHFAFLFRYEVSDDPKWETPFGGNSLSLNCIGLI